MFVLPHRRFTALLTWIFLIATPPFLPLATAQSINVELAVSSDVVGAGDRITYTVSLSNPSATSVSDAAVALQLPTDINSFSEPPNFDCGVNSSCGAGESVSWELGTLEAGDSRSVFFRTFIVDTPTASTLSLSATASTTGAMGDTESIDVSIDDSPLLRLNVAPDAGPAVPDQPFTYTLTYGNTGDKNPTNTIITMPVPSGTSFQSATGGGSENGGIVTWNLGLVETEKSGQVHVTVVPNSSLDEASLIRARAEIDPNLLGESVVGSSTLTRVHTGVPLRLEYGVSQTTHAADERLVYTLTATNTGVATLNDVSARLLLPGFISSFGEPPNVDCGVNSSCGANEVIRWTVGALEPGQTRTVFLHVTVGGSAPNGDLLRSELTASATGSTQVTAAIDVHVDPSPLLRLSIRPDAGPVAPGETLGYRVTLGNVGSDNPTGVTLRVPSPEGGTITSSTEGTISGGVLTWNVGVLQVGQSTSLWVDVTPDGGASAGDLLITSAELDSGESDEIVVRARSLIPVMPASDTPLDIRYAFNQSALGQNDGLDITLTAANTAPFNLTDVTAEILLPGFITSFGEPPNVDCGVNSSCSAHEIIHWNVGTLDAGENRSVVFRTFLTDGTDGAPAGDILRSVFLANGSGTQQISGGLDIQVDPSPLLRLSLAATAGPVTPNETLLYTLSASNTGATSPTDVTLTMPVPENTTFVSATDGGTLVGNVVTWNIDDILSVETAGQAELLVRVDASVDDGTLIRGEATLDSGESNEVVTRSQSWTPVLSGVPLVATLSADRTAAAASETVTYTIEVENTGGADVTDAAARILLPEFINSFSEPTDVNCGVNSSCSANEVVIWEIGAITGGQTASTSYSPTTSSSLPAGALLRSFAVVTATGSDPLLLETDVITTSDTQLPVEFAGFTAKAQGETVALTWSTTSEENNAGFAVERSVDGTSFTRIGFANGRGTTTESHTYRFADSDALFADTLHYRLRQVDLDGSFAFSPVVAVGITPTRVALLPSAPHPVRTTTRLRYTLPARAAVSLQMYDLLGRRVATLVEAEQPAGRHTVMLDGTQLAPGTYFARLRSGAEIQTQRVTVVR